LVFNKVAIFIQVILSNDEIGETGERFNHLMEMLQSSFTSVNKVMGALSKGMFGARVEDELNGDLATLQANVNASAESVETTMMELHQVMAGVA
jgi:methyl-accepting chemotaxis protein